MQDELCQPCQSPAYIALLFVLQFSFLAVFVIVLIAASERMVSNIDFILLNLRCALLWAADRLTVPARLRSVVWLVGAQATYGLPAAVSQILGVLRLFVSDVGFVNPACSGLSTQSSVFFLNLGGTRRASAHGDADSSASAVAVAFGVMVPLTGWTMTRNRIAYANVARYARHSGGGAEALVAVRELAIRKTWTRTFFYLFCVLKFMFEVLMVKSVEGLLCSDPGDGVWRLVAEPDMECFVPAHIPMMLAAVLLVVVMAVVFPLTGLVVTWRRRHGYGRTWLLAEVAAEELTDNFRPEVWWWGPTSLMVVRVDSRSPHAAIR
jgi:hypothetical protein